jgi:hypothetical protein
MKKTILLLLFTVTVLFLLNCQKEVSSETGTLGLTAEEYIDYTIDGVSYHLEPDSLVTLSGFNSTSLNLTTSQISGFKRLSPDRCVIFVRHPDTTTSGNFPLLNIHVQKYRSIFFSGQNVPPKVSMKNIPLKINEFYEGSMVGNFIDTSLIQHTISCNFKVKRKI